jgi:hypothetical protein
MPPVYARAAQALGGREAALLAMRSEMRLPSDQPIAVAGSMRTGA